MLKRILPMWLLLRAAGRCVANSTTASITIQTTPTPVVFADTPTPDASFDPATGIISFDQDGLLTSVFFTNVSCTTGNSTYFTDAEYSLDGGLSWIPGTNSAREEYVRGADGARTREFPFSGGFKAGTQLRFVDWADSANIRLTTTTNNGRTVPARRLTYSIIPCILP